MAWARSAMGAKRSSRSSPAVSFSHFSAALMAGMAALPRTASRAMGTHEASWTARGRQRSSRLASSAAAASRSASILARRPFEAISGCARGR